MNNFENKVRKIIRNKKPDLLDYFLFEDKYLSKKYLKDCRKFLKTKLKELTKKTKR